VATARNDPTLVLSNPTQSQRCWRLQDTIDGQKLHERWLEKASRRIEHRGPSTAMD